MVMAIFKKGDKVTIHGTEGFYKIVSVSVLTKGILQAVLEKNNSRICVTRNQGSFKHYKVMSTHKDKFEEILAEL